MTRIRKRSGIPQEFEREKLKRSMECAGIPEEVAARVAEQVQPKDDMSTQEMRKAATDLLGKINPAFAAAYESTRRLAARGSTYMSKGICRLNEDYMKAIGFESGQNVKLVAGDKELSLRAESVESLSSSEILLNDSDLEELGISSGERVQLKLAR